MLSDAEPKTKIKQMPRKMAQVRCWREHTPLPLQLVVGSVPTKAPHNLL